MARWSYDEPLLPVVTQREGSGASLREAIVGVYRRIAGARQEAQKNADEAARQLEKTEERHRGVVGKLALPAFHARRTINSVREALLDKGLDREMRRLEVMVKLFDQTLQECGVSAESLDGQSIESVSHLIEVLHCINIECAEAHVHETLEPLVKMNGRAIRLAKVISAARSEA